MIHEQQKGSLLKIFFLESSSTSPTVSFSYFHLSSVIRKKNHFGLLQLQLKFRDQEELLIASLLWEKKSGSLADLTHSFWLILERFLWFLFILPLLNPPTPNVLMNLLEALCTSLWYSNANWNTWAIYHLYLDVLSFTHFTKGGAFKK